MKNEKLIKDFKNKLQKEGFESASFEARQIVIAAEDEQQAKAMLERRLKHIPLQYILGEWEFCGLPIAVGEGVLIPRQDTETVVETALSLLKQIDSPVVYDVCAGSGCIGLSTAVLGGAKVTFFEKSPLAIEYIKKNMALNKISAEVVECDVLMTDLDFPQADMIISNPPYIKTEEINSLSLEVKCEPIMALDGGKDGLVFYRKIAQKWKRLLKSGGWLIFEIGYSQANDVINIMKQSGYKSIEVRKDYAENDRVVFGKNC